MFGFASPTKKSKTTDADPKTPKCSEPQEHNFLNVKLFDIDTTTSDSPIVPPKSGKVFENGIYAESKCGIDIANESKANWK